MAPHFDFTGLLPSARLSYEPMTQSNGRQLYALFRQDPNPFVDERFKEAQSAQEYVDFIVESQGKFRHAACDWFIKNERGQYVGVLHLYELSKETGAHTCFIGYALGTPFRKQGIAREAVRHLIQYVFAHTFEVDLIMVETRQTNYDSLRLLQHLNAIYSHARDQGSVRDFFYFLIPKSHWENPQTHTLLMPQVEDQFPGSAILQMKPIQSATLLSLDIFPRHCQEVLLPARFFNWQKEEVRTQAATYIAELYQEKQASFFMILRGRQVMGIVKCFGWGWLYEKEVGNYQPGVQVNYCFTRPLTPEIWHAFFDQLGQYVFAPPGIALIKLIPGGSTLART